MARRTVAYYQNYYREHRPENAVLFALQEVRRTKVGPDKGRNLAVAICRNAGLAEYICLSVGDIAHDIAANRRRLERHFNVPKTPTPPCVQYRDDMIDLECEGLESVTAEWHPREENGWWYSGGRYRLKLKQPKGVEWDMWISPEQMRTIQAKIEEATDGDPPRAELLEWIDQSWDDVKRIIEDEDDWHDEEKCFYADLELRQFWTEWNLVVESQESTDLIPEEYRLTLGLPEGATYGDAVRQIDKQLHAAGAKIEEWQDRVEADEEEATEGDGAVRATGP